MSRSIPQSELKILFARSGGICAFPRCGRTLVEPGSATGQAVMTGEAAHIVADSRQGPRGRETLSEADRNKHTNLILFCPEHHTIVDARLETYSVAVLRQMKIDHESHVARAVSVAPPLTPTAQRTETIYSTVLPLTHLPDAVFSAACTLEDSSEEQIKKLIKYPSFYEELVPFLLRENRIFAFHDLREADNPFAPVIDCGRARMLRSKDPWRDPEGTRHGSPFATTRRTTASTSPRRRRELRVR